MGDHDPTLPSGGDGGDLGADATQPYTDEPTPSGGERRLQRSLASTSRFQLLGTLGSGGMGMVVAAHDPQLNRKVALKLLHPELRGEDREHWTARLTREAQAMAQLAHPNVVTVYETVDLGEQLAIVMELIDGTNLRGWWKDHADWHEVVAMMLAAGRGLAAAHAVGLIHRDFKPDNVLVGADGRPRVTDFGLVTTGLRVESADLGSGDVDSMLSITGNIVGTPAYMAPEQWDGGEIDARTDQFAFCVTAWEALYRERPFRAGSLREQRANVTEAIAKPPASSKAPRWIEAALRRGLSPRASDRWPSMTALLAALDPARRRRWPLAAAALLGVGAVSASIAWAVASTTPVCPDPRAQLAGVWDGDTQAKLGAQLSSLGKAFAVDLWTSERKRIDAYVDHWAAMQLDSCTASQIKHTQSPQIGELRRLCLDRRLASLRSMTNLIATANVKLAVKLPRLVDGLDDIDDCADLDRLSAYPMPAGAAARKAIADVDAIHDAAKAQRQGGDLAGAIVTIDHGVEAARALGYPPALLDMLLAAGVYRDDIGNQAAASAALREAITVAATAHDDDGAAQAWALLIRILASEPSTLAEARSIEPAVEAAVLRSGNQPELVQELLVTRAVMAVGEDDYQTALKLSQDAAAIVGADRSNTADVRANIAKLLVVMGRPTEALPLARENLAETRARFGPNHPWVGDAQAVVAQAAQAVGDFATAQQAGEQALAIRRAAFGDDNPSVAQTLQTLANLAGRQHDEAKAQTLIREAIAIYDKVGDKVSVASATGLLAMYSNRLDDPETAATYARALDLFVAAGAEGTRQYLETAHNYASAMVDNDDCKTAMPIIDKVVAGMEKMAPSNLAMPLILRGRCLSAGGDKARAIEAYDRAYQVCTEAQCGPDGIVLSAWPLGKLLAEQHRDRARARALVEEAKATVIAAKRDGPDGQADLKRFDDWLATH